jgi:hypothetical protein
MTGCARAKITTDIKADGSWTRTVQFHAPNPGANAPAGPNLAPKLEDTFAIPSGGPWTTKKDQTDEEVSVTVERSHKLGDTQKQDVAVKGKGKGENTLLLVNQASVQETEPGKLTYREVLHWQGPLPKDTEKPDAEMLADLKNALPPALATEANVNEIGKAMNREFLLALFGPPDPMISHLLSQIVMQPDLAEREITRRMGSPMDRILTAKFGNAMSLQERRRTIVKLFSGVFKTTQSKFKSKTNPDPNKPANEESSSLVSLTFNVKLPGKIVSTNGQTDEFTNEVYWGVYPEAAALGDIVLTATCEAPKKTALHRLSLSSLRTFRR